MPVIYIVLIEHAFTIAKRVFVESKLITSSFQAEIESLAQNLEQTEQQLNKVQREASQLDSQLQESQVKKRSYIASRCSTCIIYLLLEAFWKVKQIFQLLIEFHACSFHYNSFQESIFLSFTNILDNTELLMDRLMPKFVSSRFQFVYNYSLFRHNTKKKHKRSSNS